MSPTTHNGMMSFSERSRDMDMPSFSAFFASTLENECVADAGHVDERCSLEVVVREERGHVQCADVRCQLEAVLLVEVVMQMVRGLRVVVLRTCLKVMHERQGEEMH